MIADEIKSYGGDILKFAGDALIVEWTHCMLPEGEKQQPITLLAALCASKLVDKCSDYPVTAPQDGKHIATLNIHCALGYGNVVGAHVGDMDRMEYIILGSTIQQIAVGLDQSKLGQVVASPEAINSLRNTVDFDGDLIKDGEYTLIAFKDNQKFQPKETFIRPTKSFEREPVSSQCSDWSLEEMEALQRKMSRYVHSVVYSDEFAEEEDGCDTRLRKTESELRDVFTVFIQPEMKNLDINGIAAGDQEILEILNSIMFLVNAEVTHFQAHLRQFIVDDKGLVVIANFGLRGSTFPNM